MADLRMGHLHGFLAVAQHLSYRQASRALCLSQPALSCRIQSLEENLNVKLFVRSGRDVRLTSAGRQFHAYAERIVETANRALQHMEEFKTTKSVSR